MCVLLRGSPPHAWGIRGPRFRSIRRNLGSPPHAWGIRRFHRAAAAATSGSPPHAWGIRNEGVVTRRYLPVHPHTRGEYSSMSHPTNSDAQVHPHTRGEYAMRAAARSTANAVHPHTRGEYPLSSLLVEVRSRFTPTRVGNTPARRFSHAVTIGSPPHAWGIRQPRRHAGRGHQVHPHTRGEYFKRGRSLSMIVGSPPHAWGIPR